MGVGVQGGEQKLSLGDGCMDTATIIHELLHALGLEHEALSNGRLL